MRVGLPLVVLTLSAVACQIGGQADEVEGETSTGETSTGEDESSGSESTSESESTSDGDSTESETGTDEGEPLWAIVEAYELEGEINQIWALDLSDPAVVGETEILVLDSNYGGTQLLESTPWGTHLVRYIYLDDWTTEQIRLDEQGQPELVDFVPSEIGGYVERVRFADDGQRALVQASSFGPRELWAVDFAAGEPTAADLLASVDGREGSFEFQAITPDGSAALWVSIGGEFEDPGPLMMTALDPELGPAQALSNGTVWSAGLRGDKLVYFTDEDLDDTQESWLLPLADLQATPTPGPLTKSANAWSGDGQRVCFVEGPDQLGLVEFSGLSFAATQVIDAPQAFACDLQLGDALIYPVGTFNSIQAFMVVDLSSDTPSAPMPLTSAADSVVGYSISPGRQWLGYRARDQAGARLEVTDISGPVPGTPRVLFDQLDTASTTSLQFVDDQHVLVIAATGSGPADLHVVDLAAEPLAPVLLTSATPAEQGVEYTLALTPARDSVLFQLAVPDANTSEFLWRVATSGSPVAEQLSVDAGWEIGRIETLPIAQ